MQHANCSLEVWEDENKGTGIKEAVETFEGKQAAQLISQNPYVNHINVMLDAEENKAEYLTIS